MDDVFLEVWSRRILEPTNVSFFFSGFHHLGGLFDPPPAEAESLDSCDRSCWFSSTFPARFGPVFHRVPYFMVYCSPHNNWVGSHPLYPENNPRIQRFRGPLFHSVQVESTNWSIESNPLFVAEAYLISFRFFQKEGRTRIHGSNGSYFKVTLPKSHIAQENWQ